MSAGGTQLSEIASYQSPQQSSPACATVADGLMSLPKTCETVMTIQNRVYSGEYCAEGDLARNTVVDLLVGRADIWMLLDILSFETCFYDI